MKKLFRALVALTAICGMASCGSGGDQKIALDYMPVQPREDAKWGFIGPDGKMLYEDEFKNMPSVVINGVFTVEEDGGVSVYEATAKKPTLIPGLEELADAGIMNDGVIPIVRKNERIKLVDKSGKEKLILDNFVTGLEIIGIEACSTDGMFIIQVDNKNYGVINTSGKLLINHIFTDITYLWDNRFYGKSIKGDYLLLNNKGKEIAKFEEKIVFGSKFINGKCLVLKGDDRIPGYINTNGEFTKLPEKISQFTGVYDGKIFGFETEDRTTGIMNMEGEIVISPKYEMIFQIPDDKFIAKNDDGEWFILNKNGEKETELDDFRNLTPLSAFGFGGKFELIGVDKRHRIDLYDYKGKAVTQESFYSANVETKRFVKSDYFDPFDIGLKLEGLIDNDGVNRVKLNIPISKLLPKDAEAKDYSNKYEYSLPDIHQYYNWTLSITANTNEPIASPVYTTKTEEGWFGSYTQQVLSGYRFNGNTKVTSFSINAESNRDFTEGALKAIDKQLKMRGFKESQLDEEFDFDGTVYKYGSLQVMVGPYIGRYNNPGIWIGVSDFVNSPASEATEVADSAVADSVPTAN